MKKIQLFCDTIKNNIHIYCTYILKYESIFMKNKKTIFTAALLILISLMVSCKKFNILGPNTIPPPTDFTVPDNTIPSHVDVRPETAPDNAVFGTYIKRFVYKGKWYILARNMYNYDAVNKTLTKTATNIVLSMDSDNKIVVYAKNLPETSSSSRPQIFNHLKRANIIDDSEIWYEEAPDYFNFYSINFIYVPGRQSYTYQYSITSNNLSYHSSDLLNWTTKGSRDNFVMKFPISDKVGQNGLTAFYPQIINYKIGNYINVYFKGKLYILGGARYLGYGTGRAANTTQYKVIDYGALNSDDPENYQYYNYPWNENASDIEEVRRDENKLYVKRYGYFSWNFIRTENGVDIYELNRNKTSDDVYSTSDGISWVKENNLDAYNKADICKFPHVNYYMDNNYYGPPITPHPTTPSEPNWTKVGNIYYRIVKTDYPYAPYDEIKAAANRGETQFTITDEHIKNAGLNSFMMSEVHPDDAKGDDWKLITPNNYTEQSFVWQGSESYLFNFNDKIVRLVDYDDLTVRKDDYNGLLNEAKDWRKRGDAGGYTSDYGTVYDKEECYFRAMYGEARAYMIKKISGFDGKYYYPDEAVTHYVVEFRY